MTGQHMPASMTRILIMRYRFIGDTILTTPFLRNLRRACPDARIDVLVGPRSGEVLECCPYIDELIVFDTTRFHKYDSGEGRSRSFWSYAFDLRKRRYDTVFVLKRSFSSAVLAFLTGAANRIGFDTEFRRFLLTKPLPFDPGRHEVESLLDVLRAQGIPVVDDYLEAFTSDNEQAEIERLVPELRAGGPKLLVHAAAAHPAKMYPLESWAQALKVVVRESGARLFFTGAAGDAPLYSRLASLAAVQSVDLTGKLNLRQSLALYRNLDAAVCVDSGPAHMAAAAGIPVVAIFGPTDPGRWRPWGPAHRVVADPGLKGCPCRINSTCAARPCLTALPPEMVARACLEVLTRPAGSTLDAGGIV